MLVVYTKTLCDRDILHLLLLIVQRQAQDLHHKMTEEELIMYFGSSQASPSKITQILWQIFIEDRGRLLSIEIILTTIDY